MFEVRTRPTFVIAQVTVENKVAAAMISTATVAAVSGGTFVNADVMVPTVSAGQLTVTVKSGVK